MNRQLSRNVPTTQATAGAWVWKSTYDAAGDMISSTDSNGSLTTDTYDQMNRVLAETVDANQLALTTNHGYEYNSFPTAYVVPNDSTYTYGYVKDPAGNVSVPVSYTHLTLPTKR